MDVVRQNVLNINLVDDEISTFLSLLNKVKNESLKAGFKRMLSPEDIIVLDELILQCKK